jgi:hypothetical protein
MKNYAFTFSALFALMCLLATLGYVLFGPKDMFGIPDPQWARVLFYPGVLAGLLVGEHVTSARPACYAAAIVAMTVVGALLGAAVDFLVRPSRHSASDSALNGGG